MIEAISPGLILLLAAALLPFTPARARTSIVLGTPLLTLAYMWYLPADLTVSTLYLGLEVRPVRIDSLSLVFGTVFAIMAFAGGLFAYRTASIVELTAAFAYTGSAIGAVFSGDLVTLFVFWELMALGSSMVIFAANTQLSYAAGMRYMGIHLLGGVLLMIGVVAYVLDTGSTAFNVLDEAGLARWFILAGFLINAGAPPLSAWVADAYPEASATGTVFLSAFTTKTAVYVLLRGFPGEELLVYLGLIMIFYGIIYALLENDMRRILAYSIVNQVGFMVTGVGIGTSMALNGAAAHAFAHIIYKALLLMSAGAVLHQTQRRKCTDLGGLFHTMPITTLCGTIGAFAISSFPFTSGFVSKSMISQAAADLHMAAIWFLLMAASAGVFLHAGIKFPWYVFFQKDSGLRPPEPPANMRYAMYLFAFLCIFLGIYPAPLYAILPFPVDYVPYTGEHLVSQFQLLLFSGLAFFVMLPLMKRTLTITLDVDWLYRKLGPQLAAGTYWLGERIQGATTSMSSYVTGWLLRWFHRHHGLEGILSKTWPTGSMVLWVAVLLGVFVLLANVDY